MSTRTLAIITYDFAPDPGGVQSYLHAIAVRLARHYSVFVVTPVSAGEADEPFTRIPPSASNALGYARALRGIRPGRILVGHVHPQLLLSARLATNRSAAVLGHGNDFLAAHARWHRPLTWGLLKRAQPLVANSKVSRQRLEALGSVVTAIVQPGTDPERFYPGPAPPAMPRWLTVGRLVARKGVDRVLAALTKLRRRWPALHYDIVGDGPERKRLESFARESGIAGAVTFHGRLPDSVLPAMYRQATLFVMPADEAEGGRSVEGFGIVFLEAAASGLPVVAVDSGGVSEAVEDGVSGLLVPPGDDAALVVALTRLLEDDALARQLGAAGRRRVVEYFNWDRAAATWASLLFAGAPT